MAAGESQDAVLGVWVLHCWFVGLPGHSCRHAPKGLLMLGGLPVGTGCRKVRLLQQGATLITFPDVSGMVPDA